MRTSLSVLRMFVSCCFALLLTSSAHAQIANVTNDQSTPIPGVGHDYIKMFNKSCEWTGEYPH